MNDDRQARIEEVERRLDQLEQRRTTGERSRAVMSALVPEETRRHLRAAGREQLLALRTLLDHWIKRMRDDDEDAPGGGSRESIRVE